MRPWDGMCVLQWNHKHLGGRIAGSLIQCITIRPPYQEAMLHGFRPQFATKTRKLLRGKSCPKNPSQAATSNMPPKWQRYEPIVGYPPGPSLVGSLLFHLSNTDEGFQQKRLRLDLLSDSKIFVWNLPFPKRSAKYLTFVSSSRCGVFQTHSLSPLVFQEVPTSVSYDLRISKKAIFSFWNSRV